MYVRVWVYIRYLYDDIHMYILTCEARVEEKRPKREDLTEQSIDALEAFDVGSRKVFSYECFGVPQEYVDRRGGGALPVTVRQIGMKLKACCCTVCVQTIRDPNNTIRSAGSRSINQPPIVEHVSAIPGCALAEPSDNQFLRHSMKARRKVRTTNRRVGTVPVDNGSNAPVDNVVTLVDVDWGECERCKKWRTIHRPLFFGEYFCESNATILLDSKTCAGPAELGSEEVEPGSEEAEPGSED
jgi:hypothetical protein